MKPPVHHARAAGAPQTHDHCSFGRFDWASRSSIVDGLLRGPGSSPCFVTATGRLHRDRLVRLSYIGCAGRYTFDSSASRHVQTNVNDRALCDGGHCGSRRRLFQSSFSIAFLAGLTTAWSSKQSTTSTAAIGTQVILGNRRKVGATVPTASSVSVPQQIGEAHSLV